MKYIYICGGVSEQICDHERLSVAGNKFSLNMAKALDACYGNELIFISTAGVKQEVYEKFGGEIWKGKKLNLARRGRRFVLGDLKQRKNILSLLRKIKKEFPQEDMTIFLENSPFAAATACAKVKKRFKAKCYSITIDNPFNKEFNTTGFHGRINKWMFMQGRKALKHFDGLISFTPDVMKELNVDIPFCPLAIGCDTDGMSQKKPIITDEKSVVFAGTLIYYNGIRELLGAFAQLGEEYELHIYGYGPLENEVKAATEKHKNIVFHGRFDPSNTEQILSRHQLLINTRLVDSTIENFTFPSKLIDYILTGKCVLTSAFKTLPQEYRDFVYVVDNVQEQEIANAIRKVFAEDIETRMLRGQKGIQYLIKNQTYKAIVKRMVDFVEDQRLFNPNKADQRSGR